jgi:hypothetical protein
MRFDIASYYRLLEIVDLGNDTIENSHSYISTQDLSLSQARVAREYEIIVALDLRYISANPECTYVCILPQTSDREFLFIVIS